MYPIYIHIYIYHFQSAVINGPFGGGVSFSFCFSFSFSFCFSRSFSRLFRLTLSWEMSSSEYTLLSSQMVKILSTDLRTFPSLTVNKIEPALKTTTVRISRRKSLNTASTTVNLKKKTTKPRTHFIRPAALGRTSAKDERKTMAFFRLQFCITSFAT